MNERIEKLKKKQAEELAKAEAEESARKLIPEKYLSTFLQYRSKKLAEFGATYRPENISNAMALLDLFDKEPTSSVLAKGTFTGFREKSIAEADESMNEITNIVPFWIKVDESPHSHDANIVFNYPITSGIVGISIELPSHLLRKLVQVTFKRVDFRGGYRFDNVRAHVLDPAQVLYDGSESVANAASPIKWGRGGNEYVNDYTFYWLPTGVEPASWYEVLKSLLRKV